MIGKTISHYEILEKLGAGGMGIVYKARDMRLERDVAIKFLSRHISASKEERARFKIEAKAAASLNHPNIATIHAIDEHKGEMFIVMEYLEGRELREVVRMPLGAHHQSGGFLQIDDILNYATQIATGLVVAHKKGIVHRDIKSSNIMITDDGQVKILDFSLARLVEQPAITAITKSARLGTIAYMSPEQCLCYSIDHRADIWAFGVVLYEMLTGRLPFDGDVDQVILYQILSEQPQPISREGIPSGLLQLVDTSLAKDPDDRYQRIDKVLAELKTLKEQLQYSTALKSPAIKRDESLPGLAVLPFSNLRSEPETDFLGFALAAQIIGVLDYLKNILVRPASTVRQFQNQIVDAPTAGRELRVDFILTGYYLKEAEVIRLNIELVNVHSEKIVWREAIKEKYENVFKLQDIVSEKVMRGLEIQFSHDERSRMQFDIPQNPLAYEYYLRGISAPSTIPGDQHALEMLQNSIQLDPTYAPAYAEIGSRTQSLGNLAIHYELHQEKINEAEQAYLKALSLNNELLSALSYLSMLYTETGRTEKAYELTRQMLRINPNNAFCYFALGYVYKYAGMLKASEREFDKALALDPKNRRFRSAGLTYFYLEKYEKAIAAFDLDPESNLNIYYKGEICLRQNQPQRALEYFERVIALEPEGHYGLKAKGKIAFLEGNIEKSLRFTREWETLIPCDGEDWLTLAENYSLAGDKAGCARTLRKAIAVGFFNYPFMLKDSFLDPVRGDPEIQRVLEMANAKHEAFKAKFF